MDLFSSIPPCRPYGGPVCIIGVGATGNAFAEDFWASRAAHPAFDDLYDHTEIYRREAITAVDTDLVLPGISPLYVERIAKRHEDHLRCAETIFIAIATDATREQRDHARVLGTLAKAHDLLCIVLMLRGSSFSGVNMQALSKLFGAMDAVWPLPAQYKGGDEQSGFRWFFIAMAFLEVKGIEARYALFDRHDISECLPSHGANLFSVSVTKQGANRAETAMEQALDDLYWAGAVRPEDVSVAAIIIVADQKTLRYREVERAMRIARRAFGGAGPSLYFTPTVLSAKTGDELSITIVASE